jgi:adenylate cyclase
VVKNPLPSRHGEFQPLTDNDVPPILTNLKINLLTDHNSPELSEDIYAKVSETPSEPGTFYIHFTAKIPPLQKKIDRLFLS